MVAAEVTAAVVDLEAAVAGVAVGTAAASPAVTARTSMTLMVWRGEPARAPRRALYEGDRMGLPPGAGMNGIARLHP
ncbi:hypothetical protein TNCT6_68570 [Streptomyces sp. 6-11-2]|nr:hypothetical protein TNCT6_68570 [Streptomyces sp. 6-11-2]